MLLLALLGDGEISAAIAEAGLTKNKIEGALKDVRPEVRVVLLWCGGRGAGVRACGEVVLECRAAACT